jgi:hypothetical protein
MGLASAAGIKGGEVSYSWPLRLFITITLVLILFWVPNARPLRQRDSHIPKSGFVPDARTAARIAEEVATPIYGDEVIQREKPFVAELNENGDVWIVHGHPPPDAEKTGWHGGVVMVEITKATGCILRVNHPR